MRSGEVALPNVYILRDVTLAGMRCSPEEYSFKLHLPTGQIGFSLLLGSFLAFGERARGAYGRIMVNSSGFGEKLRAIRASLKSELLDDPRRSDGVTTLAIGLISGLIWLFLVYVLPGQSPWDAKFLVVAVCFVSWGVADKLTRGWRIVAAVLRAAVLVFLLGFGAWILLDLFAAF